MRTVAVVTKKRCEMVDITTQIEQVIRKEQLSNGCVVVYVPHTTAGVTINEGADPSVKEDIISALSKIVPEQGNYSHSEGNSDAHIKASLIGSSVTIPVVNSTLQLGTWQHVFFFEGDGPRHRHVLLHCIPTSGSPSREDA